MPNPVIYLQIIYSPIEEWYVAGEIPNTVEGVFNGTRDLRGEIYAPRDYSEV